MKKIIKMFIIGFLVLGISGNAYIKNYGEGPYTEEQETEFKKDQQPHQQQKGASLKFIQLGDDRKNACMILADLLEENGLEIDYYEDGCRSKIYFDHTDIKVDKNGNVISILLSSKLLGFREFESFDVIARGYAQSGSAYADGFLKFEVKSEISYENRKQIIKYFAESFNSNYERIVFMDGYVYLEQLPKGKF